MAYEIPSGTRPSSGFSIRQRVPVSLSSAGTAIPNASGYQTVISANITTTGGKLRIDSTFIGNMPALNLGGDCRTVINGGVYSNQALHTAIGLPTLAGGATASWSGVIDPAPAAGSYTVRIEARSLVALGSVTPQAGTGLIVEEY